MGSATREALASAREALTKVAAKDALVAGTELFQAARVIGESAQLRTVLADPSAVASEKTAVIGQVFKGLGAPARSVLSEIAGSRWSSADDLLAGIEEVGIRAVSSSVAKGDALEAELFSFGAAVAGDPELELAVGSKLGSPASKSALVSTLLAKKASPQALAIVDHLVQQPRGRRIGELVRTAAATVADQAGLSIATIITAAPISAAQLERLRAGLVKSYGRELKLNLVIDPSIIGGIRVQIGDDVIDGTVSTRINDLRLQLAG